MTIPRREFLQLGAGAAALPLIGPADAAEKPSLSGPSLAERLAAYASALRYDDLDTATLERVKTLVIDSIGCAIGAWDERPVHACREIALSVSGPATVIGTARRTTTDLAAFANGVAVRYLDFNDTYVGKFAAHPSDNIPACLAVAEAERASAQELIVAIVVAYEVNCRLIDAFDISSRGWDPPVFGLPAVALAAGRLMKLDPQQMTQAVNLAINDHIPLALTRVGGTRVSREVDHAPGFAGRPMTQAEVERKFRGNAGHRWPHDQTAAVLAALWGLERTSDISTLLGKPAL